MFKYSAEFFFCKRFPILSTEVKDFGDWRKLRFGSFCRKTIPWANFLAGVASEHPVVEPAFLLFWYQSILQFDRKIRYAFASIDFFIWENGFSRTLIDATCTRSAEISGKRIIILKFKI